MTSPEWEAANEDDSDRFPQPSPHEAPTPPVDPLQSDPARVARYAEAIYAEGAYCGDCEYLGWDECSQCRAVTLGYAKAAIAVADEEHAALVAENERLRGVASAHERWRSLWEERCIRAVARAEAAEAKVAKVEALADEWGAWTPSTISPPSGTSAAYERGIRACTESLRAALADAPTERPDLDRPCACGHLLTDHLDGLACYAGTTVTSEFACDCGEWRPDAPAEQRDGSGDCSNNGHVCSCGSGTDANVHADDCNLWIDGLEAGRG